MAKTEFNKYNDGKELAAIAWKEVLLPSLDAIGLDEEDYEVVYDAIFESLPAVN